MTVLTYQSPIDRNRRVSVVLIVVVLLWSWSSRATAAQEHTQAHTEITLASDFDLHVLQYPANARHLLLWLPSKRGIRAGHREFASSIQEQGVDVWLVDLHESYLVPTGRQSYAQFRPQHIRELIDHAVQQGWRSIVVGGESRGAGPMSRRGKMIWGSR